VAYKRKNTNNKQTKYKGLGNYYPLSSYNTFNALEWGLVGLQAFHDYYPTFPKHVDPLGALLIFCNPLKSLLVIAYHL
jgi:hypothetical protein